MKKIVCYVMAICLLCIILTACGGPSWNQERAQELCNKKFEQLTADDFDEMLALLKGGWEDVYKPGIKRENADGTKGFTDEDYDFIKTYEKLVWRVNSMATASKRVVSESQTKAAEEFQERMKEDLKGMWSEK